MFFRPTKTINTNSKELEQSAKMLIRRDFELSEINDQYDTQLAEFTVLQEAIFLANQTKDRSTMFNRVGQLLITRLNYDLFFIIESTTKGMSPLVAVGFDDHPFESIYQTLEKTGMLA